MNALQVETDAQNTHMLLGGLLLTVQDAVTFEETELVGTEHLHAASPTPGDTNLLSSGMAKFVVKQMFSTQPALDIHFFLFYTMIFILSFM